MITCRPTDEKGYGGRTPPGKLLDLDSCKHLLLHFQVIFSGFVSLFFFSSLVLIDYDMLSMTLWADDDVTFGYCISSSAWACEHVNRKC